MNENEENLPEGTLDEAAPDQPDLPEPTQEPVTGNSGQTDPVSEETNNEVPFTESPVNTGLPEPSHDPGIDFNYDENSKKNDIENQTGSDNQEDGETDPEEEGNGDVTNVTIVRPPVQITYQADTEASYHVTVENEPDMPVPVLITGTLVETEPEPGIMEKRLEDYTVTEGLLLCILIVLILRIIFDYGRRLF